MVVKFSNIDFHERPILILKNARNVRLGVLGYVKNVSVDLKYNETSTIEFEVPEYVEGEPTPFYGDIVGMRTVEFQDVGRFILVSPSETGDGVQRTKTCKGYSLEYEFTYKKITLPEDTYKFWDEPNPQNTLLGMIMELMPSWSVGSVPTALQSRYRTFEVSNENLYNLIKGTIQESYGCIFDFDTMERKVYVRDITDIPVNKPVFLSHDNLAKEIEITENTEDIFTRLDVNGAEGVTIRDVNPTGTNKLINLDYYMTEDNFSSWYVNKYNQWKQICSENRQPYYLLSVQYAVRTEQKVSEEAKLADLKGELTNLENLQAVAIEGIAQGIKVQSDLDNANADIATKKKEIEAKQATISSLQTELDSMFDQMKEIVEACSFEKYFDENERETLDKYIKDGEISDSSFVVSEVSSYEDESSGESVELDEIAITGAGEVTHIDASDSVEMFDVRGGTIRVQSEGILKVEAQVISGVVEYDRKKSSFVATAYLASGYIGSKTFSGGCLSLVGQCDSHGYGAFSVSLGSLSGCYLYFTSNASEYEKRSVAWELYEYGEETLKKLSSPSYSFDVTSANFLALEDFITFRDALTLGEKIYVDLGERGILNPIVIGVQFNLDDPESMELQFSDSYSSGDSTFRLVDLLEQSISMGKNVEASKYVYSSFVDSGASTGIKEFMTSALDVAKNALMSSGDQAISWDAAGLRLRKYANDAHTDYEPEQIWMINNSIVMTADNWATAQMAIGKFHDENLGDCWGIVAPRIVGTLLAGSELIIESAKKEGGTSVFRVDGDGARLHNGDLTVTKNNKQIALNPDLGLAIGKYPLYSKSDSDSYTLNEDNANFWVDSDGNVHFKGTLHGANGDFTGAVRATSLVIISGGSEKTVDDYITDSETVAGAVIKATEAKTNADSALSKANSNESSIESLSKRIDEAELSVSPEQIKAAVKETLVIGGRNFVLDTNQGTLNWYWSLKNGGKTTEEVVEDGIRCCKFTRDDVEHSGWSVIYNDGLNYKLLEENTEYTVSVEIKASVDTDCYLDGFAQTDGTDHMDASKTAIQQHLIKDTWCKCEWLVKTIEDFSTIDINGQDVRFGVGDKSTGVSYTLRNLKIEQGNISTDWTPAPEDIESDLGALEKRVSSAELKITSDAIISTVTSSESYKELSNTANTAKSTADSAQSKANTNTNDITSLKSRVSTAEQKITSDAIVSTVTSSESYKALSNTANTAKSTADSAKSAAATAQGKADSNASDITSLTERVSKAELKITSDAILAVVKESYVADSLLVDGTYSKVEINKDKVRIVSTALEVAVPSTDGEDDVMRVDADGVHAEIVEADEIISDSVVNVAPAGSYTPASAGGLSELLEDLSGKCINGTISVSTKNVSSGDFEISNIYGNGVLKISDTGTFNTLTIKNCSCTILVHSKTFSTSGTAVTVDNCKFVDFHTCTFNAGLGLSVGSGWPASVFMNNCTGSCTQLAKVCNAATLNIVGSSKPSGTYSIETGGEIYNGTSDPNFTAASSSSIPTTTTATVSLSPTSTSTSGHSGLGSKLYQGRYTSSQSFRKGIMLFTLPTDLTSADNIISATLTLKRISGTGSGGNVTAQIRCYNVEGTVYASKSFANGQTASIDVTSAVKAMKTSGYTGLMLYNPTTTTVGSKTYTTGYARFAGKGESGEPVLKISYKK